jgi:hypothetical protein
MDLTNTSLRSRLLAVAEKLQEKITAGNSSKEIAFQVVKQYGFRYGTTHKFPSGNALVSPNAWVVIYQQISEDGTKREFVHSEPILDETEAIRTLHDHWGEVDDSLISIMLQPVVFEPELEPIDVETAVKSIKEYIDTILKHRIDEIYLGFPEGYDSEQDFFDQISEKQDRQLNQLIDKLNASPGLLAKIDGKRAVISEKQWKAKNGKETYPPKELENVVLRKIKASQINPLIAIEEYLFPLGGDHLLFALARAHERSYESYGAEKIRPSLVADSNIGVQIDQSDLSAVIETMAVRGFDFQPVFHKGKCVGTLEIKEIMKYLQNHEFGSLPATVNRDGLTERGLLSPAPPILDGRLSLHRSNEIMYYGIGCVLVNYDKDQWTEDEQKELDKSLKEGLHIFTRHDYVVAQIRGTTSNQESRQDA